MKTPPAVISSFDSMEVVMGKFERSKTAFIPVLRDGKYFGFITKVSILENYREKLREMVIE